MNKKSIVLRTAALSVAAAFICSVTGDSYQMLKNSKSSVPDDKVTAKELSAEIVQADDTVSVAEQLADACEEKNAEEISAVCDLIINEMDETRNEVKAYSLDINEWASDEIKERQNKYENELNVRYAQTAAALSELKNGKDTEKNLEIVRNSFSDPDEHHRSDAAPNIESSAKSVEEITGTMSMKSVAVNSPEPQPDDLKYDGNTEIPEILAQLAEELDDPNNIYLFVKNTIKTETYTGSKKGALITLAQTGGNDIDQASLLIALLRARNIPARYVTGTVQIPPEQALEITGSDDIDAAGRILASGYRDVKKIKNNGKVVGYKMTRTWVEAYIPYTDYRGTGNKSGDKVWVQLDPSFKKVDIRTESVKADYTENDKALLEMVNNASAENKEAFGEAVSIPDTIECYYSDIEFTNDAYIPSSLPYTTVSVDERYSFIKDSDKDTVSISIGFDDLLSAPVSELYGKSVVIDFEPASQYDQEVIDRYENLTEVPAYLVNVVPVVNVGSKKYKGSNECSLGSAQEMIVSIRESGNTTMLNDTVYSGSVYALNLDLQTISPDEAKAAQHRIDNAKENFTGKNACDPKEIGAFLDFAGKYYFSLCDNMDSIFEAEMNIDKVRHLGLAITGYQFKREAMFGSVTSLDYGSFYIDVGFNSSSVISRSGNRDTEKKYILSAGTIESYLEGYIWEQLIDKEKSCISTISVMNAAAKQGIDFCYLTSANIDAQLEKCNIKDSVKNEIRNFINQGFVIELVPETLSIGDWTGTAYIALDPDTCSASYMISGGTAGGSSMDFPDLFVLNNNLFLINFELADLSIATSYCDFLKAGIDFDPIGRASGMLGMFSGAFALGSAMEMRYANYDYIFEYAERGEDVMREYMIFTLSNAMDTAISVASYVIGMCGEAGGLVSASLSALYDTIKFEIETICNIENGDYEADAESAICCIWDWLGVWLATL